MEGKKNININRSPSWMGREEIRRGDVAWADMFVDRQNIFAGVREEGYGSR